MGSAESDWLITYYIRDAQGNVMATYTDKDDDGGFYLSEQHIYGSSRVGMRSLELDLTDLPESGDVISHYLGQKQFELSNHLGNVLTVVSDYAIPQASGGSVEYYSAQIISSTGYYPFGMVMPGRFYDPSNGYRFGFQGQEEDEEYWDRAIVYEYRVEDPRLGRFFSLDPLGFAFPWNSPYAFSENRVLDMVELEGLEAAPTEDKENAEPPPATDKDGYTDYHGSFSVKCTRPAYPNESAADQPTAKTPSSPAKRSPAPKAGSGGPRGTSLVAPISSSSLGKSDITSVRIPSPQYRQKTSGPADYFAVGGLMMTGTESALKTSANNTQLLHGTSKTTGRLRTVSNQTLTRATKIQLTHAARLAKNFGRGFGVLGAVTTTYESLLDGSYSLGDFTKTSINLLTTFTPLGWGYGIIDLGVSLTTGKSLTDRIGAAIDN